MLDAKADELMVYLFGSGLYMTLFYVVSTTSPYTIQKMPLMYDTT